MPKGRPTEFARDNRRHVINRLRNQKSRTKRGREIVGYFALLDDERRKYFGSSGDTPGAIFAFKHLTKSASTAASNDPTVPDRQINLLAGHSAGIKEHCVVRRNVQLACEAVERYYFGGTKASRNVN